MKRLSLKEVKYLLKVDNSYSIRIDGSRKHIHLVKFNGSSYDIIGYLTSKQFSKLVLSFVVDVLSNIRSKFDNKTLLKEVK